jgi:hypothetical protein
MLLSDVTKSVNLTPVEVQAEYTKTLTELQELTKQSDDILARITTLQKRLKALATLIEQDGPPFMTPDTAAVEAHVRVLTPMLTSRIERIFIDRPATVFHTQDLLKELKQMGWDMSEQTNSAATVGTIAGRLHKRGIIRRTTKDGYIAWALAQRK